MEQDEVSEQAVRAGEARATDHHHDSVDVTEDSLAEHLASEHGIDLPDDLSFGALRGLHDRFHGEGHAIDD